MKARVTLALALGLWLAACDGRPPIVAEDQFIAMRSDAVEVACGEGFPLEVVRIWNKRWTPEVWDDRTLEPLLVRSLDVDRREDSERVEETRTFMAYAFRREDLAVPPTRFVVRDGNGEQRVARSEPFELTVRAEIDADAPGEPELPPGPLSGRGGLGGWTWGAGALVVLLTLWSVARRKRPIATTVPATPAPESLPLGPSAFEQALEALAALGRRSIEDEAAWIALHEEAASVVRRYLAEGHRLGAAEWTSEELLAAVRAHSDDLHAALRVVLARCDGVKFAARAADAAGCRSLLAAAETCVRQADAT